MHRLVVFLVETPLACIRRVELIVCDEFIELNIKSFKALMKSFKALKLRSCLEKFVIHYQLGAAHLNCSSSSKIILKELKHESYYK